MLFCQMFDVCSQWNPQGRSFDYYVKQEANELRHRKFLLHAFSTPPIAFHNIVFTMFFLFSIFLLFFKNCSCSENECDDHVLYAARKSKQFLREESGSCHGFCSNPFSGNEGRSNWCHYCRLAARYNFEYVCVCVFPRLNSFPLRSSQWSFISFSLYWSWFLFFIFLFSL